jgi:uncharacterized protein
MNEANSRTRIERLVDVLPRAGGVLFGLALIVLAVSFMVARDLKFDQNIESLYARDDPQLNRYLESKQLFGGDEFLVVAWPEPNLFVPGEDELTEQASARIRRFAERLSAVEGINPASTQSLERVLRFPFGKRKVLQVVQGTLFNEARTVTSIVLRLAPETDAEKRAATFREVRELAASHEPRAFVTGEPIHIHDLFRYVEEDGRLLFRFSFAILSLVLLILLRSLRWIVLPAIMVAISIKSTEAILVLSETKLSMVSAILNSLVTIIGVATTTHLAVRFRQHRERYPAGEALRRTMSELLGPIFWTCMTTACGFLALLSSQITPMRSFGLMMALASALVFVAVVLVLPAGVLSFRRRDGESSDAPADRPLIALLERNSAFVVGHPKRVLLLTLAIVAVAGLGFRYLEVETDFSKNFRADSPIVQSLEFVESELGGTGTLEVNFPAPEILTDGFLEQVNDLATELKELESDGKKLLTSVESLYAAMQLVPRVPIVLSTPRKRLDRVKPIQPEFEPTLYNAERGRMRIFMRTYEQQSAARKNLVIDRVSETAKPYFEDSQVSGVFVLLTFLIDSLMADQLVSFAWAATLIFCMMTIAFRSLAMGLIGLVPNLFPIVLVLGGMGWMGLRVNIATAMITCVSMGLTVDSSIHFLSAYRRERRAGHALEHALMLTTQDVGRALIFANLALVAGFSVLMFSQFVPLIYFGFLVSLAMVGGLFGNLLLLPILLRFAEGRSEPRGRDVNSVEAVS